VPTPIASGGSQHRPRAARPSRVVSVAATLFDLWGQLSAASALLTLPIAVWEFSLGVYLIVKGFKALAHHGCHGDCLTITDHRYPASLAGRRSAALIHYLALQSWVCIRDTGLNVNGFLGSAELALKR
jgi:hypothetical protein